MKKERVYINEYFTEDSFKIYRVCKHPMKACEEPADCTNDGGFFYYREAVDDFIEEHADVIEVVHDHRSEEDQ